jgi:transposase-like protein
MNFWFWYAIDPVTRKIVFYKISWNRTILTCKKFFQDLEKCYGKKPKLVVTDGGTRYKILPRIGFCHEIFV